MQKHPPHKEAGVVGENKFCSRFGLAATTAGDQQTTKAEQSERRRLGDIFKLSPDEDAGVALGTGEAISRRAGSIDDVRGTS